MKKNLLLITALVVVNSCPLFCMDSPAKNVSKKPAGQNNNKGYIEIDPKPIIYHGGPKLQFYGEYRPRQLENGLVSFPISSCDPLPLRTFGALRFFFISATEGYWPTVGAAVIVEDPAISNIVVVRAKNDSGNRIEVYLGFDKNKCNRKDKKIIYAAQLLAVNAKLGSSHISATLFDNVKYLSAMELSHEIREPLGNKADWGWHSAAFKKVFGQLLGQEWTLYDCPEACDWYFTHDEVRIGNKQMGSNKVYWTQTENKLKGISYHKP